jgi:hypothetical protein
LPRDGTYIANDKVSFTVDHQGGQVRLRFVDNDEVFYLTSEAAPMGGRVLKYDTGVVALSGDRLGRLTLYTTTARGGLPAEFVDVPMSVDPPPVSAKDMKAFAAKLAQELSTETISPSALPPIGTISPVGHAACIDVRCHAQRDICARRYRQELPSVASWRTGCISCACCKGQDPA